MAWQENRKKASTPLEMLPFSSAAGFKALLEFLTGFIH
jgi:hypothetical protein